MGACDTGGGKRHSMDNENNKSYKSDYYSNILYNNKIVNLQIKFSHIKIKYCISHNNKRNSTFITEISIGQTNFRLMVNQGKVPVIDSKNIFDFSSELKLSDLQKIHLSINIYEFIDDININIFNNMTILPEEYKAKSKYKSSFKKDLFSFIFGSKRCEFAMEGENPLSTNCRISFICEIENKEKIQISVQYKGNKKISKLVFKEKNENIMTSTNSFSDEFSIETPPITIKELIQSELYLESNEDDIDYEYISLNDLKYSIIKELGGNILKQLPDYIKLTLDSPFNDNIIPLNPLNQSINKSYLSKSVGDAYYNNNSGLGGLENNLFEKTKDNIYLTMENLPLIFQTSSLYLTEYGHLYSTSALNIINNDDNINNYRKTCNISADDFYAKLKSIYSSFGKGNLDYNNILNELNNILKRSIDEEKFYYLYPNVELLIKMNILLMNIAIKLIQYITNIKDENKINLFLKTINYILKREEIENGVLLLCLKKEQSSVNLKTIYNDFFYKILKLNDYFRAKNFPSSQNYLIEIYSRLYFKNKYIRDAIFNTLKPEAISDKYQNDIFIYDIISDDELNKYLDQKVINLINQINTTKYFANLFSGGILFFKNILFHLSELNINDFPYDFTNFIDNKKIIILLMKYAKNKKIENLENEFFEISTLLSGSFDAINQINSSLIQGTNGYNHISVYKLFDYLNCLLEYYYTKEQCKLIMNYSDLEKAIEILIVKFDSSLSLNKLFWFYYSSSHLIISEHLKYFINRWCNKKFNKFAFHWSFSVREVFFKLYIFIFNDRLKDKEGNLIKIKNFPHYLEKIDKKSPYRDESKKDYDLINKEYQEWKNAAGNLNGVQNTKIEYPPIFLPSPISPDNIDVKYISK